MILKISLVKIDNPIEVNTINDIDANTSNRTNTELTYTPVIPKISTNTFISFLIEVSFWEIFLDKSNQIPIPAKIIHKEWSRKESSVETGVCSATESTKGSVVVKRGLIAFRYLKEGKGKKSNSSLIVIKNEPATIIKINKTNPFLVLFWLLLIFWIKMQPTKNTVGSINENPPKPNTKLGPGLSNEPEIKRNMPRSEERRVGKECRSRWSPYH